MAEVVSEDALDKWRTAGRVTAKARDLAASLIQPGAKLEAVADRVEGFIRESGAQPAFPLNLSADHWAAHYTPSLGDPMEFVAGQVVKVDIGAHVDGYPADSAVTVEVGGARRHTDLIRASREALAAAVEMVGPNLQLAVVGETIERTIQAYGFKPISNLTGHLIKRNELHAGKSVPNVGKGKGDGEPGVTRAWEVYAIEPFATNGAGQVENGKAGNIYRFRGLRRVKDPDARRLAEALEREHGSLPFAARWTKGLCEHPARSVNALRQAGVLHAYPVLIEKAGGAVSQHEHTVLITESGAQLLT
ncbi:MAG TPA: type II methionyl aminopeptidase [Candidatus Thermoplasmatota archaeon]